MHPILQTLIEQKQLIAEHKATIAHHKATITELERIIGEYTAQLTESDVIRELLKDAGIAKCRVMAPYQAKQEPNIINRPVLIDGDVIDVSVNTNTGELLFDGNPKDNFS